MRQMVFGNLHLSYLCFLFVRLFTSRSRSTELQTVILGPVNRASGPWEPCIHSLGPLKP